MTQGFSSDLSKGTLTTACNALRKFEWTDRYQRLATAETSCFSHEFPLVGLGPSQIRRLVDDYNQPPRRPLDDEEEEVFIAQEVSVRGMLQFSDRLFVLTGLAYQFVTLLKEAGELARLGQLAGLQPAGEIEFYTKLPYLTPDLPSANSFRFITYQNELGHALAMGARLLWWCAAAHKPEEFGWSSYQSSIFRCHPIWITYVGYKRTLGSPPFCRLEGLPLKLMKEAAAHFIAHPGQKLETVADAALNTGPPKDGFDDKGFFWRYGKLVSVNPKFQFYRVLKRFFVSEQRTVHREEFCRAAFVKHDFTKNPEVPRKSFRSAIDRFNLKCLDLGLRMEADECGDYVVLKLL